MNSITPQMVILAFEKTGFKPVKNFFYLEEKEGVCSCAIGAIHAANGGTLDRVAAYRYVKGLYGRRYIGGFMAGYDGTGFKSPTQEGKQGYADGRAAWEAVKGQFKHAQ